METKVCTKCEIEKPVEEFNWRNKKLNKRRGACKECTREFDNQKYQTDSGRRERLRENSLKRIEWNREFVKRVRQRSKCSKCGEDSWYVLDFHHKGDKEYNIPIMVQGNYSVSKIKDEIRKCDILCANCHREEHFLNGY